jgi:hypothetical protein
MISLPAFVAVVTTLPPTFLTVATVPSAALHTSLPHFGSEGSEGNLGKFGRGGACGIDGNFGRLGILGSPHPAAALTGASRTNKPRIKGTSDLTTTSCCLIVWTAPVVSSLFAQRSVAAIATPNLPESTWQSTLPRPKDKRLRSKLRSAYTPALQNRKTGMPSFMALSARLS